ncbi:hypothetical protein J2Z19_003629 [Ensifer adhaerens]|uniref:Uncharacterized protein n=1 Tax=Ensifer adhaerens TaxID=106592 RepID=A0ACC5SYJ5_ENSAD|nr:hypothetical protein [Ensifer adhaerens]
MLQFGRGSVSLIGAIFAGLVGPGQPSCYIYGNVPQMEPHRKVVDCTQIGLASSAPLTAFSTQCGIHGTQGPAFDSSSACPHLLSANKERNDCGRLFFSSRRTGRADGHVPSPRMRGEG